MLSVGEIIPHLSVQDDDYRSYANFYESFICRQALTNALAGLNQGSVLHNEYVEFNSVDDNDDKDPFPDGYFLRKTTNLVTGGRFIRSDSLFRVGLNMNGRPAIRK